MTEQFSKTILYGDAITSRVLVHRINKLTKRLIRKSKTNRILHKENGTLEIFNNSANTKRKHRKYNNSLIKESTVSMQILSGTCLPNSVFRKKIKEAEGEYPTPLLNDVSSVHLYYEKMFDMSIEELMDKADKIIQENEKTERQEIIQFHFGLGQTPLYDKYSRF